MTSPSFAEALAGVLEALATVDKALSGHRVTMSDVALAQNAAIAAMARWESRQRLRDDAALVKRIDNQVRFSGYAEPVVELFEELVFGGLSGTTGTTTTKEG